MTDKLRAELGIYKSLIEMAKSKDSLSDRIKIFFTEDIFCNINQVVQEYEDEIPNDIIDDYTNLEQNLANQTINEKEAIDIISALYLTLNDL
jgi:hypothetical protein